MQAGRPRSDAEQPCAGGVASVSDLPLDLKIQAPVLLRFAAETCYFYPGFLLARARLSPEGGHRSHRDQRTESATANQIHVPGACIPFQLVKFASFANDSAHLTQQPGTAVSGPVCGRSEPPRPRFAPDRQPR